MTNAVINLSGSVLRQIRIWICVLVQGSSFLNLRPVALCTDIWLRYLTIGKCTGQVTAHDQSQPSKKDPLLILREWNRQIR